MTKQFIFLLTCLVAISCQKKSNKSRTSASLQDSICEIPGDTAGAIEGDFKITPTGTLQYSIPFRTLPSGSGIGFKSGMVYSNQTAGKILGQGWSLAGFSSITRCTKIKLIDGEKRGVRFSNDDALCLGGDRLVLVSGDAGATGSIYKTFVEYTSF